MPEDLLDIDEVHTTILVEMSCIADVMSMLDIVNDYLFDNNEVHTAILITFLVLLLFFQGYYVNAYLFHTNQVHTAILIKFI